MCFRGHHIDACSHEAEFCLAPLTGVNTVGDGARALTEICLEYNNILSFMCKCFHCVLFHKDFRQIGCFSLGQRTVSITTLFIPCWLVKYCWIYLAPVSQWNTATVHVFYTVHLPVGQKYTICHVLKYIKYFTNFTQQLEIVVLLFIQLHDRGETPPLPCAAHGGAANLLRGSETDCSLDTTKLV